MDKQCKICGNLVTRFVKSRNQYWDWCSNKCMGIDPDILEKKQKTNINKFGGHPMHNAESRQKLVDTFRAKYGVDNPSKSPVVKEKMRATFVANYGVDNPSKSPEIVEKIQKSAVERFETQKDFILEKRKKTNLEKFGRNTNKQIHISQESLHLMKDIEWLKHQHYELKKSCKQIAEELRVSPTPILNLFAENDLSVIRHSVSTVEKDIIEYLSNITDTVIEQSNRKILTSQEIDIWLPEKNLAIEVNGIYWHCEEKGKSKKYHISKTLECEKQNIHLLHIYDTEWNDPIKNDIIKSKLNHLLGNSVKIPARKCQVKEIDNQSYKAFVEQNHLQGAISSRIKIGLFYNDQLIAAAGFGNSRFNRSFDFELLRYCSKKYHSVVGGLSKILYYFDKTHGPNSLISYADRRWSTNINNNLYQSAGFEIVGQSSPNYKYFHLNDPELMLSRNQFQKHLLEKKLKTYDPDLSEYQNMSLNGYYRIWDCGNLIYYRK